MTMTNTSTALALGGLDHLLRYLLSGCGHSGQVAARLFEVLAEQPDLDGDTRCLCESLQQALETGRLARA
jgi:hypothetical protein